MRCKKIFKKALSLVIVFALMLSSVPIVAAQQTTFVPTGESVTEQEFSALLENTQVEVLTELIDKREADTKYFAMSDGSIKACIYPQAVHYLKDGKYEQIDNSLTLKNSNGKNVYVNKENSFKATLPEEFTDEYVSFENQNGYVKFKLKGAVKIKAEKTATKQTASSDKTIVKNVNSNLKYKNIKQDIDIEYDLAGNKLKETIVLNKKTKESFVFEILTSAKSATLNSDNSVSFYGEDQEALYVMSAPFMVDANAEYSDDIVVGLVKTENGYELTYTPNYDWLKAKERVYPVRLDPTIFEDIEKTATTDTYISNNQTSTSNAKGGSDIINIGRRTATTGNQLVSRGLIRFSLPDEITAMDNIVSCKLYLTHRIESDGYVNNNGIQLDLHELTGSFSEDSTWWGNAPIFDPKIVDYTFVNTDNKYPEQTTHSYDCFDITPLATKWHIGAENNGVLIKYHDDTTAVSSNKQVFYFAADSKYYGDIAKYVEITYRNAIGLESYWTYSSYSAGNYAAVNVNNYNGNAVMTIAGPGISGNIMPVSITHVFNNTQAPRAPGCPPKSQLNYNQQVVVSDQPGYPYCWIDEDGTRHYFYTDSSGKMVDEDGLNLTLTVNSASTASRYTITDKYGIKKEFNSAGYLVKIIDTDNNYIGITVGATGVITNIRDGAGRNYVFTYNSDGMLNTITDPVGRVYTYSYNSWSELIYVDYPKENETDSDTYVALSYNNANIGWVYSSDGTILCVDYILKNYVPTRVGTVKYGTADEYEAPTGEYIIEDSFLYGHNSTEITDKNDRKYTYQFNNWAQTVGVVNHQTGTVDTYTYKNADKSQFSNNINHRLIENSKTQQSVVNMVSNASFQSNISGYTTYGTGHSNSITYVSTKGNVIGGSAKFYQTLTDPYPLWLGQDFTNLDGGYYTLSAYVNTAGATLRGSGAVAYIEVKTPSGSAYTWSASAAVLKTESAEWKRICVTSYIPQGYTARIKFGFLDSTVSGTAWFDNIQFEKGETPSSFNLLKNSDFKNGKTDWVSAGTVTATAISGDNKPPVTNGISISPTVEGNSRIVQTINISGNSGDVFSVGAWARADSVVLDAKGKKATPRYSIALEFYKDGVYKSSSMISANPAYNGWQFVTGKAIATTDYTHVQFYCIYNSNANIGYFAMPYVYREEYGQTYTYDNDGNVISSTDLAKTESTFTYRFGRPAAVSDPSGSRILYSTTADSNYRLKAAQTTDGQRYEYTMDSKGNATSVVMGSDKFTTAPSADKTYYIRNAYSGNAMNCTNRSTAGSDVNNSNWLSSSANQVWKFVATTETDVYEIMPQGSTLCLNVRGGTSSDNAVIELAARTGAASQRFKLVVNSDGTITLLTKCSNYEKSVDGQPGASQNISNGSAIKQYSPTESAGQKWYLIEYNPDITDSAFIRSDATYTADGNYPATETDTLGQTATYGYNTQNGNLDYTVDSNDIRTEYTYNSVNGDVEWVTVKNENNQTLGSVNYTYDDDRRLTGIAANGQNYLFGYDAYGRTLTTKVGTSNSEPLSQNYYDNYNRLSQMNYGNDIVAHYAYDSVDNLKTLWYGNNSDLSFNYSYTKEGGIGLIRDTFNNLRTRYTYDLSGRLVGARRNVNANNDYGTTVAELDYKYEDKTNRIASSVTNVFGSKVDTQYVYGDASKGQIVNAIYGIKRFYGAYHMLYSYDALGRVTNRDIDYIGRDYTYTYCAGGYGANSTTTMVSSITSNGVTTGYQYYPTGSIQTITQNGTTVASYVYDDLNQLTSANQNGIQYTYTYGQNGNLLSKSNGTVTDTYVYGNSNWKDLLTSYNGQSIIYDTIGNPLTYRNGITMTWQRGRQLSTVTNGATTASYTYDESGTRYTKTVNGDVTTFAVIDGTLYGQLMPDGKKLVYLYDIDGTPYGFNYNGSNYFYDKNLQGDILAVINSSNSVLAKYTYDPWGKLLSVTDANGNDISANASHIGNINPLRYRGYYYDAETGFYYLNSRYYDPETCRFVNADGYVSTGQGITGYNMFAYCGNNPVNRADPTGQFWSETWEFAKTAVAEIGKTMGVMSPAYAVCGGAAIADGPLPFGDVLAAAGAILLTTGAIGYGIYQVSQAPDISIPKVEEKSEVLDIPNRPDRSVIFPVNPNTFNPVGLVKVPRAGTKNGVLISWMDPRTNTEVFRWDENPNYSYGPHYHIHGTGHYYPGTIVPEPYATMYFPVG